MSLDSFQGEGLLKQGMTLSIRNARMIDRTLLRGPTMQSQASAFYVFQGAEPDYYIASGVVTTQYGFGGNMPTANNTTGGVNASLLQWENGKLDLGPITSGTVLLNPRAFFDPRTQASEDTYTVSGDITVAIASGDVKNFVF